VLNVLPSGRKLRANLYAYPADAWGRFLAANHLLPVAGRRLVFESKAIGCRTGQKQRRAGGEAPHPMVRGFAARVKPDRGTIAREGPGKEPAFQEDAQSAPTDSWLSPYHDSPPPRFPRRRSRVTADSFSPDVPPGVPDRGMYWFHSGKTPCIFRPGLEPRTDPKDAGGYSERCAKSWQCAQDIAHA
jgi:hypothetical protein